MYRLIGPDGAAYESDTPGRLGGRRRLKAYGRLDCPSARRWIAAGHYVRKRVFFADEAAAIAAGYRPLRPMPSQALCGMESGSRRVREGQKLTRSADCSSVSVARGASPPYAR